MKNYKIKPKIGILLNCNRDTGSNFNNQFNYSLRDRYFRWVYLTGGIPYGIPIIDAAIPSFIQFFDGFLIPGGSYTSPHYWYADSLNKESSDSNPFPTLISPRVSFDESFINQLLASQKPILGICLGMQLLAVSNGCKMVKNIIHHALLLIIIPVLKRRTNTLLIFSPIRYYLTFLEMT